MTFKENINRICLERGTNLTAIEQGMITSTTKERLEELELEKNDVEGRIAREEMKKTTLGERANNVLARFVQEWWQQ